MTIPTEPPSRVLIAGASVRAAVQSAQRSGLSKVIAADLFQDGDLGEAMRCPLVDRYANLASAAARLRPEAWMYTGALENLPDVVQSIEVPLLGNTAEVLRAVRDPWRVAAALQHGGVPTIPLAHAAEDVPHNGLWLEKRRASAGGRQIRVVEPSFRQSRRDADVYYQQLVRGVSVSAVYVAAAGHCQLLGSTQQWIGVGDPSAGRFQYLGSIGPLPLSARRRQQWDQIGQILVTHFSLCGLFGVDAILADNQLLPVEVNPRLTASVEVLERAQPWNAFELHSRATARGELPEFVEPQSMWRAAKQILFAPRDVEVSEAFLVWAQSQNANVRWPRLADLPATAGSVRQGAPLLSLLAGPHKTDDVRELRQKITRQAEGVLSRVAD